MKFVKRECWEDFIMNLNNQLVNTKLTKHNRDVDLEMGTDRYFISETGGAFIYFLPITNECDIGVIRFGIETPNYYSIGLQLRAIMDGNTKILLPVDFIEKIMYHLDVLES
jgi:hypothetical protein